MYNNLKLNDSSLKQTLILSVAFMCIFSAFKTTNLISKLVLEGVHEDDPTFNGNGYTALTILYISFACATWFAPFLINLIGIKFGLIFGGFFYVLYIFGFIHPNILTLYTFSGFVGFGASILWAAQGSFISEISTDSYLISRNSGIFWAFNEGSLLIGSLFIFWNFNKAKYINAEIREYIASTLTFTGILGLLLLFCLTNPKKKTNNAEPSNFFFSSNLLLLCICGIFTGLEFSFCTGVLASSIGFTENYGPRMSKYLVGLVGIVIGTAEILGGFGFGWISSKMGANNKSKLVFLSVILFLTSYLLIYLNLPNESIFGPTWEVSYFDPPLPYITGLSAFLLGLADACLQTQILTTLGYHYPGKSSAFALFKFFQSIGAVVTFFYSSYIGLHYQMIVLSVASIVSFISFCIFEKLSSSNYYEKIEDF